MDMLKNVAAASPLAVWYVWLFSRFVDWLTQYGSPRRPADIGYVVAQVALVVLAISVVMAMTFRKPVIRALKGSLPRIAAVAGTFFTGILLFLPSHGLSLGWSIASSVLIFLGATLGIYSTTHIFSSFSITPQARELTTSGPYTVVRHPMYLSEAIVLLGVSMYYEQPWAFAVLLTHLGIQLMRIRFEEELLSATFTGYRTYRQRTACIIPYVY